MIPALVLAGGFGTRLRSVVGELPKPLASVAGQPFLWWLLRHLEGQGIQEVFLSVGYRHELVSRQFGDRLDTLRLHYVVETQPLGTGGAIVAAAARMGAEEFLVLNGDTLASLDLAGFVASARQSQADIAIAVVPVADAARYGTVEIDGSSRVCAFAEKGRAGAGLINAGVYFVKRSALPVDGDSQRPFSFEQEFLGLHLERLRVMAVPVVHDFIDIGVPEDYARAQTKVPRFVAGR